MLKGANVIKVIGALLLLCTLVSCSQQFARKSCMAITSQAQYCLAPTVNALSAQSDISLSQMISMSHGQDNHELMTQLELSSQRMTLVGLAPLGQALFTLVYDGDTLQSEQSRLLGETFNAEYLMAIMQLIYWPTEQINQHLTDAQLRVTPCENALCKQLIDADGEQITINYSELNPWQAKISVTIKSADILLHITPL
ncbi:DUF3261 domain-containing protein [Shewanella phaeophyticola]|uniref:DUF3261 domain-containing protein n=1 Tax=Shewanella phaeophyticola TaxID=2978345 RepID=A0ABT2P7E1_9GAMM|nr:DUF3261 domain-containing protein [Shewanella sp. KJ10-1]MCT8988573.1 DUF3261 domain-containing protein [Shewanella sp. KJ10-1]